MYSTFKSLKFKYKNIKNAIILYVISILLMSYIVLLYIISLKDCKSFQKRSWKNWNSDKFKVYRNKKLE